MADQLSKMAATIIGSRYQHTLQIEPVPELTGNKRSYLFAFFRRFGPGRSVFSVDSAESGSVTAFTHFLSFSIYCHTPSRTF